MQAVLDALCLLCLWHELPFWAKLLIGLVLIGAAFLGGWWAVLGAGGGVVAAAVAGSVGAYGATSAYATADSFVDNTLYGNGLDAIEDGVNLISPIPPPVADATGFKLPGAEASDGLADQAMDAARDHKQRMKDLENELFGEE